MSDNLNTSNSNPDWKSYTETHNTDDIIRATDFNNEFSIKVDQNGGYSLNQNLISCSIDQNSSIRNTTTTITIADLITFYNNYSVQTGSWNPVFKINSDDPVTTSYSSQGTYKSFAGITYYWGQITVSNIGIVNGIIDNGTMNFAENYSLTDVAQNNVASTGGNGSGASFNITSKQVYQTNNITMTTNGKDYKSGDILTIGNGGTGNVTSVSLGGEITAISNDIPVIPLTIQPSIANTTIKGGNGTGVSFLLSSRSQMLYLPNTVELNNSGTGYTVNDTINLINIGTITVKTVTNETSNGTILTGTPTLSTTQYTINNAGDSVTSTGGTGTGATFKVTTTSNTTYLPKEIDLNAAGTGYAVNDTVTITNAGVITITAIGTDGAISTYTTALSGTAKSTDMAGTGVTQQSTTGSGTGATFNIVSTSTTIYPIASATLVSGGSGYAVNDVIDVGGGVANFKVETVSTAVTGGEILTFTTELSTTPQTNDMSGTSITGTTSGSGTGASFTVTSTANTYYYLTNVVLNNQGSGYENLDAITLSLNDVVIDNITVSSVTDVGNITGISYTLNQNYLQNDPSGNNISPTGGSGTGALFSINSTQYFTYDTISIESGGENYQIGDLLSVKQYGSYTVSEITSANGTMTISNFPNSNSDNIEVTTNVDYFDGYDGGNLYLRFENSVINFYKDQKNTVLNTTDINNSFILKFSGYY